MSYYVSTIFVAFVSLLVLQLVIAQHSLLFTFFTALSFTPLPTCLGIHLLSSLPYMFCSPFRINMFQLRPFFMYTNTKLANFN